MRYMQYLEDCGILDVEGTVSKGSTVGAVYNWELGGVSCVGCVGVVDCGWERDCLEGLEDVWTVQVY